MLGDAKRIIVLQQDATASQNSSYVHIAFSQACTSEFGERYYRIGEAT